MGSKFRDYADPMTISMKTRVMIWGRAAHRCSWCKKLLEIDDGCIKQPSLVGEIAHIVAEKEDGPRGDRNFSVQERNSYENLLLLCLEHHKLIDDNPVEYPVSDLKEMKQRHEEWVRKSLARYKPADQQNAETYAAYIEEWGCRVRLDDWTGWTASIMRGSTAQISRQFYKDLSHLSDWLFERVWPPTLPSLAEALKNFQHVLSDFLEILGARVNFDGESADLVTSKFLGESEDWLESEEYIALANEYKFHLELIFDLLLELTRAGNRVCDEVRAHLDPAFRVKEGVLIAAISDLRGRKKIRAEYENRSIRYRGLNEFKFERKTRNYHFGQGANPNELSESLFNDDTLTEAAEQLQGKLASFKNVERRASEDIRRLEALLESATVRIEYWIDGPNDDPLDSNEIRSIGWAELDGRWQIVHHASHYEHGGRKQTPLLEMPAFTKIACAAYLPNLLREIANLVPDWHLERGDRL